MKEKVIFVPGWHNYGIDMLFPKHQLWFGWLYTELQKIDVQVVAPDYPDAYMCRTQFWLPFIKNIGADENAILIGHSTGAIASMRFAEETRF